MNAKKQAQLPEQTRFSQHSFDFQSIIPQQAAQVFEWLIAHSVVCYDPLWFLGIISTRCAYALCAAVAQAHALAAATIRATTRDTATGNSIFRCQWCSSNVPQHEADRSYSLYIIWYLLMNATNQAESLDFCNFCLVGQTQSSHW